MIVLDTNVVSELLRLRPDATMLEWLSRQSRRELRITSVTQAEMWLGVALLPAGARRDGLKLSMGRLFAEDFEAQSLPFDQAAAAAYAEVNAVRRSAGRPIAILDAQIASICLSRDAPLATRDTGGFEGCGLTLINPWLC